MPVAGARPALSGAKAEADRFTKAQLALILAKVVKRRVIKLVPLKAQPRRLAYHIFGCPVLALRVFFGVG